jgi:hypothetical protein
METPWKCYGDAEFVPEMTLMGRATDCLTQMISFGFLCEVFVCLFPAPLLSSTVMEVQNTKTDAKEGSRCLETTVNDGSLNVGEGRSVPGSLWAMLHIPLTVCLGDERKSPGGWKRVTILLQHQHSLPQAPDSTIFKNHLLIHFAFCETSISILHSDRLKLCIR